ncbi:hypothetical protein GCM10027605_37320 [Micromonospora zhanjiangensis]
MTLALVGFLLAVAYRQTVADEPGRSHAREGLVAQIKQREVVADQLTDRANDLRAEVARQRDAELTGSDAARLRELEAATGLRRVRGDGVLVRVADGPAKKDTMTGAQGPNLALVRDSDLQGIANGLWAAGAEAISINGQRLTATSTIRLAGEAILVDYRPVTGPYEVSAIGPGQLERRFKDSQVARLFRSLTAEYGMSFDVRSVDNLDLPAANEPQLRYAQLPAQPSPTPSGVGATRTPPPPEAADDRCTRVDRRRGARHLAQPHRSGGVAALPADRRGGRPGRGVRRGTGEARPDLRRQAVRHLVHLERPGRRGDRLSG